MALKVSLGSDATFDLDSAGDLAKHFLPGLESTVRFSRTDVLDLPIGEVPSGALPIGFDFSAAPTWKIAQAAPITISVQPSASCTLSILKPGDVMYQYAVGDDPQQQVPVKVPADRHYASIVMKCSLGLEGGAKFSDGNFGVSGSVSSNDQFRIAHYLPVSPTVTLRECVVSLFSRFVLPFHSASVGEMQDGECLDFEFVGKLALGFGATYGFSSVLLGGRSGGDVKASFQTPIGNAVVDAAPAFQVAAGFKLTYNHEDSFRVVVNRVSGAERNGVDLYLLRTDSSGISATESFGITLSAGVKFQTDAATLNSEIGRVSQKFLNASAAPLAPKLTAAADALVNDINSSVNGLLAKADGHKIGLELTQSKTATGTALFIFGLDFSGGAAGVDAYEKAMRGDYAAAMMCTGVSLDPRSFIEQTYVASAGITLQLFELLTFHDVTEYIEKNETRYIGSRTFQIRSTEGIKAISGAGNKTQEADLYFVAQCRKAAAGTLSDVDVSLQTTFVDRGNKVGFQQSEIVLASVGLGEASDTVRNWTVRNGGHALSVTFSAPVGLLAGIQLCDQTNYEDFVRAFRQVSGPANTVAQTFLDSFGRYSDWLSFNRVKNDQAGSNHPGDRLSEGNATPSIWPEGYPPTDAALRILVQAHIYAAQHFMNFCEFVKQLAVALPGVVQDQQYRSMLSAIHGMIRHEIDFPTYFLKPGLVALMSLAGGKASTGALPASDASGDIAIHCEFAAS